MSKTRMFALLTGTLCTAAALSLAPQTEPQGIEVAARYHLRMRTQRFFDRAAQPQTAPQYPVRNAPNPHAEQKPASQMPSFPISILQGDVRLG